MRNFMKKAEKDSECGVTNPGSNVTVYVSVHGLTQIPAFDFNLHSHNSGN